MKYFIPISKQDILKYFSFPSVFFVQRKPNYIDLILQRARVTTELNIILSTFLKSVLLTCPLSQEGPHMKGLNNIAFIQLSVTKIYYAFILLCFLSYFTEESWEGKI